MTDTITLHLTCRYAGLCRVSLHEPEVYKFYDYDRGNIGKVWHYHYHYVDPIEDAVAKCTSMHRYEHVAYTIPRAALVEDCVLYRLPEISSPKPGGWGGYIEDRGLALWSTSTAGIRRLRFYHYDVFAATPDVTYDVAREGLIPLADIHIWDADLAPLVPQPEGPASQWQEEILAGLRKKLACIERAAGAAVPA